MYLIINGNDKAATIAPNDTYWKRIKIIKKRDTQINAANGCNPIITPKDVATPFPPLNCAKIGKTCPITAKMNLFKK